MTLFQKFILLVGVVASGLGGVSVARYQMIDAAAPPVIWATLLGGLGAAGYGLKAMPTAGRRTGGPGLFSQITERLQSPAAVAGSQRTIEIPGWDDDVADDMASLNRLAARCRVIKDEAIKTEALRLTCRLNQLLFCAYFNVPPTAKDGE